MGVNTGNEHGGNDRVIYGCCLSYLVMLMKIQSSVVQ